LAKPFTQQGLRIRPSSREEAVVTSAREHFERTLVKARGQLVGSVAALEHPRRGDAANYGEVFLRDNVPVMAYLLLQGRYEIVRHFLDVSLDLQSSTYQTRGVFPTSFVEQDGDLIADYGQRSIGRITSVDPTLWWPVLCWLYVRRSRDLEFGTSEKVQRGIQLLLDLVLHPSFEGTPVLFVPDCAFMIDRPMDVWGAPLEVEVLLYGCLRSCCHLMELAQHGRVSRLLDQRLVLTKQWVHDLRSFLLKHYWVTSKTVQVLRRRPTEQYGDNQHQNEFNVQPQVIPPWLQDWLENRGGYLIGNMRTGRPDFRFYSLGNSLACLFGLLTAPQQRALFRLVLHNRQDLMAQMPMRISHPPLDAEEWMNKTGSDPKNWAWSYHNGGHWPSLLWYLGAAVLLHGQRHPTADVLLMAQMKAMLEECYWSQLNQLPRQQWAEYFDGPTGTWVGQQARTYQTWTIVGFLLMHHLLRVKPEDVGLIDIQPFDPYLKMGYPGNSHRV
jgi:beta-fructofuranosidase